MPCHFIWTWWLIQCYNLNSLRPSDAWCVGKLIIIASDKGLLPGRRQAIIWTNAVILLIGPLGTKFNEILIEIHTFSFAKMHLKMSSAKWHPFCLGPNVPNSSPPNATYMRQWIGSAFFQIMACCLFSAKPLSKPMQGYCNQNTELFIHENASENIICEMRAILSRGDGLTLQVPVPYINTLRSRKHGRHFADDTFKRIFLNENVRISTNNSLNIVPKGSINNIPAVVQIMAWRRPGDKPLSEPMMVWSLTHICVARP